MASVVDFDPKSTIVVATGNAHKVIEIEAILKHVLPQFSFVALHDFGSFDDPVEDGATFYDNAVIKARHALDAVGCMYALADDSGICVDALSGAPGIYSARYAGEHGNDKANNKKLLEALKDVDDAHRRAHFHCSIVLIKRECDSSVEQIFRGEGNCLGYIAHEEIGAQGFGYDPLFLPDAAQATHRSMAQLSADEKNAISHRRRALEDLALKLQ